MIHNSFPNRFCVFWWYGITNHAGRFCYTRCFEDVIFREGLYSVAHII